MPRIFYFSRTAKNFYMTVPFMHNFGRLSDKFPNDFFKSNFSHFTYQVRLFFVEKGKPKTFGLKKCVGERNQKNSFFNINTLKSAFRILRKITLKPL